MIKRHVLAACRHLLAPVVRLLLRSGVTWGEFADLSKEVFVDVARRLKPVIIATRELFVGRP